MKRGLGYGLMVVIGGGEFWFIVRTCPVNNVTKAFDFKGIEIGREERIVGQTNTVLDPM